MKIVGIDLSLTGTGLASVERIEGTGLDLDRIEVDTHVVGTKPDSGTLYSRHKRLEVMAARIVAYAKDATMVAIEGPSYASGGRGTWDRAGLWWWVVSVLETVGTPVIEVPPTTRTKWATDNGRASKSAVAVAICRMWPDVTTHDDNDADALCLATIGAQLLEMKGVPQKAYQKKALSKLIVPSEL